MSTVTKGFEYVCVCLCVCLATRKDGSCQSAIPSARCLTGCNGHLRFPVSLFEWLQGKYQQKEKCQQDKQLLQP